MITSPSFAGKKYAVLGLARSGLAAAEALLASGAEVMAWDRQENAREAAPSGTQLSDPLDADLTGFAGVVVSPGVPLNTHPIAQHAAKFGVPVIGDIELFAQARSDLPPHRVVGITGTNGKSTTTALIHHLCEESGLPTLMGGNIGLPIMAQNPLQPAGGHSGVYVLELSSYQIDLTYSLDCEIAVLLNISPDHLDRYADFDAYAASKARLFSMQSPGHHAVISGEDEKSRHVAADLLVAGKNVTDLAGASVDGQEAWPSLQGPHNRQNAIVAAAAAKALGIDEEVLQNGLKSFAGLPHRLERIAIHDGVLYVNDSKATNQASAAPALAAYPPDNDRPRIHWIVGGLAKEPGLQECAAYLGHVAAAYTVGEAGPAFAELLTPHCAVERCEMICEAVQRAANAAQPGDVVLLSPACASFDQFRDYEQRGEHFRSIVAEVTGGAGL